MLLMSRLANDMISSIPMIRSRGVRYTGLNFKKDCIKLSVSNGTNMFNGLPKWVMTDLNRE